MLLGVDFPIGLPLIYARQAGVDDFLALLPQPGRWVAAALFWTLGQPAP